MKTAKRILCAFFLVSLSSVLINCGGGSGNSGEGEVGRYTERPSGVVAGIAFDGLVIDGTVTVYEWDGKFGKKIGEGITDQSGNYEITLTEIRSQPIAIKITDGRYTEEVSGLVVGLAKEDFLISVTNYEQGTSISSSITYYTTLAAGLAEVFYRQGMTASESVERGNQEISTLIGLDIQKTIPFDITDAGNAEPKINDSIKYGFLTAAISQLTKDISTENGEATPHFNHNSIGFAAIGYNDIAHDGLLDGVGEAGVLNMGIVEISESFYRLKTALAIIKLSDSDVNRVLRDNSEIVELAVEYNNRETMIFSEEIEYLSAEKPLIVKFDVEAGDLLYGEISINYEITSPVNISKVALLFDENDVVIKDMKGGTFVYDTTLLSDGEHNISMRIENILGGKAEITYVVEVSNKELTIKNLSPSEDNFVSGLFNITASTSGSGGIIDVEITIDNQFFLIPVDSTNPFIEFDSTRLKDGENSYTVVATNAAGISGSESSLFYVDNTAPVVTTNFDVFEYEKGVIKFNANAVEENLETLSLYLNGELKVEGVEDIGYEIDSTALADGDYVVVAIAVDKADNRTEVERKFVIDNTAPVITTNFDVFEYEKGIIKFNANGVEENLETLSLYLNGELKVEGVEDIGYELDSTALADGDYVVVAISVDKAGNRTEVERKFVIDNTAPNITFLNIVSGSSISGNQTIRLSGVDKVSPDTIDLYFDDKMIRTENLNGEYEFAFNTYLYQSGVHIIKAVARDKAENIVTKQITLNFIESSIRAISPNDGALVGHSVGIIKVDFNGILPFTRVHLFVDGALAATKNDVVGLASFNFAFDTLVSGDHIFRVTAVDTGGHSIERVVTYSADNIKPTINWDIASGQHITGIFKVKADVIDANWQSSTIYVNDSFVSTAGQNIEVNIDTTKFGEGTKTIKVVAVDQRGNTSTVSKSFVFDHAAPRITSINLVNGMKLFGQMTVQGRVDYGASMNYVELFIDGARYDLDANSIFSLTLNPGSFTEGVHRVEVRASDTLGRYDSQLFDITFLHKAVKLSETVTTAEYCDDSGPNDRSCVWRHKIEIQDTHTSERTTNITLSSQIWTKKSAWWSQDKSAYYVEIIHNGCRRSGKSYDPLYATYTDVNGVKATIRLRHEYGGVAGFCRSWD